MSGPMIAGFFAITVKAEHQAAFLDACIFEAQSATSEEDGIFEFHILVDSTDPNRFYFYEIFRDQAAFDAHRKADVVRTWWDTIQPMIDGEVEAIASMQPLFPTHKGFEARKPGLLQW